MNPEGRAQGMDGLTVREIEGWPKRRWERAAWALHPVWHLVDRDHAPHIAYDEQVGEWRGGTEVRHAPLPTEGAVCSRCIRACRAETAPAMEVA